MKALLIVFLLNGEGFAVPFQLMETCLKAEQWLDTDEVEESRCYER